MAVLGVLSENCLDINMERTYYEREGCAAKQDKG